MYSLLDLKGVFSHENIPVGHIGTHKSSYFSISTSNGDHE